MQSECASSSSYLSTTGLDWWRRLFFVNRVRETKHERQHAPKPTHTHTRKHVVVSLCFWFSLGFFSSLLLFALLVSSAPCLPGDDRAVNGSEKQTKIATGANVPIWRSPGKWRETPSGPRFLYQFPTTNEAVLRRKIPYKSSPKLDGWLPFHPHSNVCKWVQSKQRCHIYQIYQFFLVLPDVRC